MTYYLNEKQVAERLGMSVRTLQGWRRRGVGPASHKAGLRRVLYDPAEVENWLRQRAKNSHSTGENSDARS